MEYIYLNKTNVCILWDWIYFQEIIDLLFWLNQQDVYIPGNINVYIFYSQKNIIKVCAIQSFWAIILSAFLRDHLHFSGEDNFSILFIWLFIES